MRPRPKCARKGVPTAPFLKMFSNAIPSTEETGAGGLQVMANLSGLVGPCFKAERRERSRVWLSGRHFLSTQEVLDSVPAHRRTHTHAHTHTRALTHTCSHTHVLTHTHSVQVDRDCM